MNLWINVKRESLVKLSRRSTASSSTTPRRGIFWATRISLVRSAREFRASARANVIIKKVEHGALLLHARRLIFRAAVSAGDVVDPTAP
jgi:hypothetical protein